MTKPMRVSHDSGVTIIVSPARNGLYSAEIQHPDGFTYFLFQGFAPTKQDALELAQEGLSS